MTDLDGFIAQWPEASEPCRRMFIALMEFLQRQEGSCLDFQARPGVSYSLRARQQRQVEKPLFVMVDVIDDEPRWLSVCFYGRMVLDPEGRGDYVPGGLLGEDGICFDAEGYSTELLEYLQERIIEAHRAAA